MTEENPCSGTIERVDGGFQGRLRRFYAHEPAALWRMLTEPAEFAKWIAPGTMELREGGRVHIDFAESGIVIDSTITALEVPRLLEYSWSSGDEPQRPLRWEVVPAEGGAELALTVFTPADEDVAKACAGFEGHLDILAGALEGVPIKFPFEHYMAARKAYSEMLA